MLVFEVREPSLPSEIVAEMVVPHHWPPAGHRHICGEGWTVAPRAGRTSLWAHEAGSRGRRVLGRLPRLVLPDSSKRTPWPSGGRLLGCSTGLSLRPLASDGAVRREGPGAALDGREKEQWEGCARSGWGRALVAGAGRPGLSGSSGGRDSPATRRKETSSWREPLGPGLQSCCCGARLPGPSRATCLASSPAAHSWSPPGPGC